MRLDLRLNEMTSNLWLFEHLQHIFLAESDILIHI